MKIPIYYFAEPGGETSGPLPIGKIRGLVASGQLSKEALLVDEDGEWRPLREMIPDDPLFAASSNEAAPRTAAQDASQPARGSRSVWAGAPQPSAASPVIRVFGVIELIAGGIWLFGLLASYLINGTPISAYTGMGAAGCIFFGVMTLAVAEVLDRLCEISHMLYGGFTGRLKPDK